MMKEYLKMKNNVNTGRHSIRVVLSAEDEEFIKWLSKRDEVSFQEELQMVFYTELRELQEYFKEEESR